MGAVPAIGRLGGRSAAFDPTAPTRKDFLWWTGLRLKDIRPVWEEVTGQLEHLVVDGMDYYLDPSTLERYTAL